MERLSIDEPSLIVSGLGAKGCVMRALLFSCRTGTVLNFANKIKNQEMVEALECFWLTSVAFSMIQDGRLLGSLRASMCSIVGEERCEVAESD